MFSSREKIFVSYSSDNTQFVEDKILPRIDQAKRDKWFAPESIRGGENWRERLLEGLQSCDRLLVVVSKESLGSGWVKNELEVVTKPLVEKNAKLSGEKVYRAILPVVLEPRGRYGEVLNGAAFNTTSSTEVTLDPFLLHPYLALVHFIKYPFNKQLEDQLSASAGQLEADDSLSETQRTTIKAYLKQRDHARKQLLLAIRNPNRLRRSRGPSEKITSLLYSATLQRAALAAGIIAITCLLLFFRYGDPRFPSAASQQHDFAVQVTDPGANTYTGDDLVNAIPVNLGNGPAVVGFQVRSGGSARDVLLRFISEPAPPVENIPQDEIADTPGESTGVAPEITIDRISRIPPGNIAKDFSVLNEEPIHLAASFYSDGQSTTKYASVRPESVPAQRPEIEVRPSRARRPSAETEVIEVGPDGIHLAIRAWTVEGFERIKDVLIRVRKPDPEDVIETPQPEFTIDDVQIIGFVDNRGSLKGAKEIGAATRWEDALATDAQDIDGLRIRVTTSTNEEATRFVRFSPADLRVYYRQSLLEWLEAKETIPIELASEPSILRMRIEAGRATRETSVNLPARPVALRPPTIEVADTPSKWMPAVRGRRINLQSGARRPLYIKATGPGGSSETNVVLVPAPTPTPRVELQLEPFDLRANGADPRRYTFLRLTEPSRIWAMDVDSRQPLKKEAYIVPVAPRRVVPDFTVVSAKATSQQVTASYRYSNVSELRINGRNYPKFDKNANAGTYTSRGTGKIEFEAVSSDGIKVAAQVIPVSIKTNGGGGRPPAPIPRVSPIDNPVINRGTFRPRSVPPTNGRNPVK